MRFHNSGTKKSNTINPIFWEIVKSHNAKGERVYTVKTRTDSTRPDIPWPHLGKTVETTIEFKTLADARNWVQLAL